MRWCRLRCGVGLGSLLGLSACAAGSGGDGEPAPTPSAAQAHASANDSGSPAGRSGGSVQVRPDPGPTAPPEREAVADPATPAAAMPSTPEAAPPDTPPAAEDAPPTPAPMAPLPKGYLAFDRACEPGASSITIAAVGDILLHRELQRQAYADPQRFRALWSALEPNLAAADVTYANLETPIAQGIDRWRKERADPGLKMDNKVYSGYARFNAHPSLAEDLAAAGFDVVSTANNHSLDRGALGIDRTLAALDEAEIEHTGSLTQDDDNRLWYAVTEASGIRVAWLACTKHTNWEKDEHDQVLQCFPDQERVLEEVRILAIRQDIDAIIVTPHWGKEYWPAHNRRQSKFARKLIEAGATAVIGAHPHVLQPWEKVTTEDGREALVMYSLGNFLSHQREVARRTAVVLYVGLTKTKDGETRITGARYLPMYVRMEGDKEKFFAEPVTSKKATAAEWAHAVTSLGAANRIAADEPLVMAPHCDPKWKPGPARVRSTALEEALEAEALAEAAEEAAKGKAKAKAKSKSKGKSKGKSKSKGKAKSED